MVAVSVSTSSRSCMGTVSHWGCATAVPCPQAPAHRAAPLWGAEQCPPAVSCPAPQRQRVAVDSSEGCDWGRAVGSWGGGTQRDGPIPRQHPALQLSLPVGSCTTSSTVTVCRICQVSWGEPSPKGKLRHRDLGIKRDFGDLPSIGRVAQHAGSCSPCAAADTAGGGLPRPLPSRAGADHRGSAGVRRRHGLGPTAALRAAGQCLGTARSPRSSVSQCSPQCPLARSRWKIPDLGRNAWVRAPWLCCAYWVGTGGTGGSPPVGAGAQPQAEGLVPPAHKYHASVTWGPQCLQDSKAQLWASA